MKALKQTKLLPDHKRFVCVFWGETIGEVSIIKERGAKKEILYISITAESSVELITDNICGRNKPNFMFRPFATSSKYIAEYYNTDLCLILAI